MENPRRPDLSTSAGRAATIAQYGDIDAAIAAGVFDTPQTMPLCEAMILGLLRQGVSRYFAIFGHGSTALADMLRVYEEAGVVRTWQFRNEIEMTHAATAARWAHGVPCAVVTSIGPGALQAMAGSLAASSNGVGVYHIYGDETTHGEGYNMQQVPKPQQNIYGQITALMGRSYVLHTPEALREAMRQGAATVFHPVKAGPFYLLAPINTQPKPVTLSISNLPVRPQLSPIAPSDTGTLQQTAQRITQTSKVVIKAGGGTRDHADELTRFARAAGATVVLSPGSTGVMRDDDPLNMHVGGSKGSLSGNYAMEQAELLIAIGTRAVCQADCSGLGYPNVKHVININGDLDDALHYNHTTALWGDIGATLRVLTPLLAENAPANGKSEWLSECARAKAQWQRIKADRCAPEPLFDPVWNQPVLTQPAAIALACDMAKQIEAIKYFDAGDVQANGFQIVEDDTPRTTITEAGASYMGFAVSALLGAIVSDTPRYGVAFTGDGSFMMNPQVLIDGVEHGVRGTIVIFDNRRMAAITNLQLAQYGTEYRTNDGVSVDYVALAGAVSGVRALWGGTNADQLRAALTSAFAYEGLSVVHVPVYHGDDERGGMGAYGRWNVGNWCADAEADYVTASI